ALYNAEQLSVALGTALGDGHHGPKQKAYEAYKHEILGGAYYTNAQTKHLRTMLYPNGTKSLMGALPYLNEIALAFMYMNDGNLRTAPPVTRRFNGIGNKRFTCTIATHCFTKNEQLAFTKLLNDRWGIVAKLHVQGGGKYHEVFFDQGNAYKFLALIAPYVHESMNYKLDPDSRQITKRLINRQFLGFAASKVVSVVEQVTNSKLYDIEVEGTHCFFANNYLVHNSIKWWAIKEAILKHPNIEPSEIEKLVGDFVFNAVAGTEKFNIGEPIEVMEIGTGYMMIKREVFEKVANAMPYIRYKPDHVGQKFFDGSRYIDAYFDCYIDRQHTPDCKWDCAESHGSSERYLSEDYSFCQRARKVGVKVWLCPWMKTTHVGTYAFQGDLQAHANYIGKL
ncbi:MAG: hypothetical protein ACREQ5_08465, partial [Candidatus Dormibacteria bacterium]